MSEPNTEGERFERLNQAVLDLTEELLRLRLEVNTLRQERDSSVQGRPVRREDQAGRSRSVRTPAPVEAQVASDFFTVGDTVEITNNHNGLQGQRGTVVNVTRLQVQIRLPGRADFIYRKYTNVRLVDTLEEDDSFGSQTSSDLEQ